MDNLSSPPGYAKRPPAKRRCALMAFREIPGCLHDAPPIPDSDKAPINVLDESESANRWDRLVSSTNRHFMLLAQSEWPIKLVSDSSHFYN